MLHCDAHGGGGGGGVGGLIRGILRLLSLKGTYRALWQTIDNSPSAGNRKKSPPGGPVNRATMYQKNRFFSVSEK